MKRICPGCSRPLNRFSLDGKTFYACNGDGLLAPADSLKSAFKDPQLADYCLSRVQAPLNEFKESKRRCPECGGGFHNFVSNTFSFLHIDVCRRCRVFWFDQGEWEAMKAGTFHARVSSTMAPPRPRQAGMPSTGPREFIEVEDINLLSMLMPIEQSLRVKTKPAILTIMIIFFAFATTMLARKHPDFVMNWAYYPEFPLGKWGFSHVTSMLMHSSFRHFFSNALFLYLAGDDVEDEVGHWEFLKLFLLSGVVGHLVYSALKVSTPSVGMSGAVSGVIAYYGIRFPHHRFSFFRQIPLRFSFVQLNLSARACLGFYILINSAGYLAQILTGGSGVNYAAHIGGLIFGGLYALTRD